MTEDLTKVDFFRDSRLTDDPYTFYEALRNKCPVRKEEHYGVTMVTGWQEAVDVYNDSETFSSCIDPWNEIICPDLSINSTVCEPLLSSMPDRMESIRSRACFVSTRSAMTSYWPTSNAPFQHAQKSSHSTRKDTEICSRPPLSQWYSHLFVIDGVNSQSILKA